MDNNMSSEFPYELIKTLAYGQAGFELFLHPIVFAISALNFTVLCSARLLHPNLRYILLVESASIMVFELQRVALVSEKFLSGNIFNSGNMILQFISRFFTLFRNSTGHVLIMERLIATFWAQHYENRRDTFLSLAWTLLLLAICSVNEFTNLHSWGVTPLTIGTNFVIVLLSLVEFLILCLNGAYNIRKYDKIVLSLNKRYSLSEKYQLSENIRTSRQLAPAFLCHFLNNILNLAKTSVTFFAWINEDYQMSFFYALILSSSSILSAIIEITVITHHPILKKRAKKLLKSAICCWKHSSTNRIEDECSTPENRRISEPKNIHGHPLIRPADSDSYFKILAISWG